MENSSWRASLVGTVKAVQWVQVYSEREIVYFCLGVYLLAMGEGGWWI
jgi:hypothetical protein